MPVSLEVKKTRAHQAQCMRKLAKKYGTTAAPDGASTTAVNAMVLALRQHSDFAEQARLLMDAAMNAFECTFAQPAIEGEKGDCVKGTGSERLPQASEYEHNCEGEQHSDDDGEKGAEPPKTASNKN